MNLQDQIDALTIAVNNQTTTVNEAIALLNNPPAGATPAQLAAIGALVDTMGVNNINLATASAGSNSVKSVTPKGV